MKERMITFSGPEVRAILAGRKTQTRRIVKPQPPANDAVQKLSGSGYSWMPPEASFDYWRPAGPVWAVRQLMGIEPRLRCPFGTVGDRLWVRETFCQIPKSKPSGYFTNPNWVNRVAWYAADNDKPMWGGPWRSPVLMPRWASRIDMEITGVRVERLQEITNNDAIDEGFPGDRWYEGHGEIGEMEPWEQFRDYWQEINGPGSWDANPWVWVIEFRRLDQ